MASESCAAVIHTHICLANMQVHDWNMHFACMTHAATITTRAVTVPRDRYERGIPPQLENHKKNKSGLTYALLQKVAL